MITMSKCVICQKKSVSATVDAIPVCHEHNQAYLAEAALDLPMVERVVHKTLKIAMVYRQQQAEMDQDYQYCIDLLREQFGDKRAALSRHYRQMHPDVFSEDGAIRLPGEE